MDTIIIRDLAIETIIGLYDWERVARQTVLIDLDLACQFKEAAEKDLLQHTVDYSAVCEVVTKLAQEKKFQLIETFAEQTAQLLIEEFHIPWVKVGVYKIDTLPQVSKVGVCIERGQRPADIEACCG